MKIISIAVAAALALPSPALANVIHVLSFRYKPNVTASQRADLARRIIELRQTARRDGRPYIVSIRGGSAVSREGFDQKFQQLFIIEFKTVADRNYFVGPPYLKVMDPVHSAVADRVMPNVERAADGALTGIFVFDFDERASVGMTKR